MSYDTMHGHRVSLLPASVRVCFAGFPDAAQGRFPGFWHSGATGACERLFRAAVVRRVDLSWWWPCLAGQDAFVGFLQMPLLAVRAEGAVEPGDGRGVLFGRGFGRCRADGLADGRERLLAPGSAHPAAVADLVEALREDVGAEALGELLYRDGVGFLGVVVGAVSPGVGDAAVLDAFDARVADGDLVGVAGEVFEGFGRFSGRGLGVDDPFSALELMPLGSDAFGVTSR